MDLSFCFFFPFSSFSWYLSPLPCGIPVVCGEYGSLAMMMTMMTMTIMAIMDIALALAW